MKHKLSFRCPICGRVPKEEVVNRNFISYTMICPFCNVRYDWYLDGKRMTEEPECLQLSLSLDISKN